ncbi:hypothetical protein LX81_02934 [Palleronia aestuarii]|uniref:Uncharacterized protein n=1 Tax=Palleronia aestuarii TaxID=568105 RepID=A0A2W7N2S7_9RHOB|nr:hypothetical protein [Palleronia aestuarii]PZX14351.1 hypothetical protein LX81_02934 [Palleronia aestuarii]
MDDPTGNDADDGTEARLHQALEELARTREAYARLSRARDRHDEEKAAEHANLRNRILILESRRDAKLAAPRNDRDELKTLQERNRAVWASNAALVERNKALLVRNRRLEAEARVLRKDRAAMLASARWRAGGMISDATRRIGPATLALPFRLLGLVRRRKAPARALPPRKT